MSYITLVKGEVSPGINKIHKSSNEVTLCTHVPISYHTSFRIRTFFMYAFYWDGLILFPTIFCHYIILKADLA